MSYKYDNEFRLNKITLAPGARLVDGDGNDSLWTPTSTQRHGLGRELEFNDGTGRKFRYCKNGAAALAKCLMGQSSVPVANWTEQANTYGSAGAAGDTTVTINLATTATKDQFAGGWLQMADATPAECLGDMYYIKGNDAGVAATAGYAVKLYLGDYGGLRNAITTATQMTVILNPYKDTVVVPAGAPTSIPIGVPMVIVPIGYYYWSQTRGPASILIDTDTIVVGDIVGESSTGGVDGAAGLIGDATDEPTWGWVMVVNTNGQTDQPAIVNLTLE